MIPSSLSLSDETVPVRRACKIHEYFSSFRFTFLSAPPYILGDCKTSLVLSPLLSLSLSYPPRIASLCPQSRQKRFVRSPRKIASPHVYYNTHSFFRGTTDASSGRNKTGDRGVTIWFMLEPMSRGRWKVNGIGGAFWTRVNSTRSRELDFVLRGRSCLLLLLVFFSLSFGRKWSDNGEAINESKPMLYNNFVRRIKKDKR